MTMTTRCLAVDDHPAVRQGLGLMFGDTPDLELVGHVESGEEVVEAVERLQPEVVIMDVRLPGIDGISAVKQAMQLAQRLGATVHLVSAYEPVPEGRLREERQQIPEDLQWMVNPREDVDATLEEAGKTLKEAGVTVQIHAREGDPADAILDVAEEQGADLIVVGNKGMTGAKRFLLGSVPNKISHHAPCSVMIIRTT